MNMNTIRRNIAPALLSIAIVSAAVLLPKAFAADIKGFGEVRCNLKETKCLVINGYELSKPRVSLLTRHFCFEAKPFVMKIGGTWHSRFTCNGVLKEMRFQAVSYEK